MKNQSEDSVGIQAIDLQTLFSQVDKVGKDVAAQREGVAIQQALFGVQLQKKTEERMRSVTAAAETGEGQRVKERNKGRNRDGKPGDYAARDADTDDDAPRPDTLNAFRDPALGKNLDVSM